MQGVFSGITEFEISKGLTSLSIFHRKPSITCSLLQPLQKYFFTELLGTEVFVLDSIHKTKYSRSLLSLDTSVTTSVGVVLGEVYQDDKLGEWFVEIRCSEEVMPYMFEMKKNYFTYQLWNALKLKSVNQIRMYEILK